MPMPRLHLPDPHWGKLQTVPPLIPEAEEHLCKYVLKKGSRKGKECGVPFLTKAKNARYCNAHRALAAEESRREYAEKLKKKQAAFRKIGLR
jgi:hypothetical protein